MIIFRENTQTGLKCGVNDDGDLFLGNSKTGYNLPNTPENLFFVLTDFDYYNVEEES